MNQEEQEEKEGKGGGSEVEVRRGEDERASALSAGALLRVALMGNRAVGLRRCMCELRQPGRTTRPR